MLILFKMIESIDMTLCVISFLVMLKMNKKKGASLGFDKIKNKKSGLICFLGNKKNKKKTTCLPASSVFQKSGLRNTCLFIFGLSVFSVFRCSNSKFSIFFFNYLSYKKEKKKLIFLSVWANTAAPDQ